MINIILGIYASFFLDKFKEDLITPAHITVYEGESVEIICYTSTYSRWTYKYGDIHSDYLIHSNSIILKNLREKDSGVYVCSGTRSSRQTFDVHSEVLIGGTVVNWSA